MKRKTDQVDEKIDETWLIPYADLLTLLLALFIVLFASSILDQSKLERLSESFSAAFSGGSGIFTKSSYVELPEELSSFRERRTDEMGDDGTVESEIDEDDVRSYLARMFEQETIQLGELKSDLDFYIQEQGLSSQLDTTLNNHRLLITFRDSALFDPASADLKPDSVALARKVGEMLAKYPDYNIIVSGHTDNVPINTVRFPSNWELSAMRALNFMKILLEFDIDPKRVSSTGYGEYHPIADNDTPEGRAANRRVEVSIERNFLAEHLYEDILPDIQ